MYNDTVKREDIKKGLEAWLTMNKYFNPKSKSNKIPLSEIFAVIDNAPDTPTHYTDGYKTGFGEGYKQALTDITGRFKDKMSEILEEVNTDVKT